MQLNPSQGELELGICYLHAVLVSAIEVEEEEEEEEEPDLVSDIHLSVRYQNRVLCL